MTSEEKQPLRTYVNDFDPVHLDSAMEVYIEFAPDTMKGTYINIEVNANGAVTHRYGKVPPDRRPYTEFTDARCTVDTVVEDNSWSVEIFIPLQYVKDLFGRDSFKPGDKIRCNFYKICESKIPTGHYGSFTEIVSPVPNFNLPEFFAECVIV